MNEDQLSNTPATNDSDSNDRSLTEQRLSNGREYTKFVHQNPSSNRRKLILHFDNRNTLQVANNVSATTIEQGVNNFLTGVLWGYEKDDGQWEWASDSPSLLKPANCPQCITYFKYLENQIVKEAIDRRDLRIKTGSFIKNEGERFRRYYDELIESLRYYNKDSSERNNEDDILHEEKSQDENSNSLTRLTDADNRKRRQSALHNLVVPVNGYRSENGTLYHYVLPSFFRLIQYLQETNRDFVVYLRTMGDDSTNFLANAKRVISNEHPAFRFNQTLTVNFQPGQIERPNSQEIRLKMKFPDDPEEQIIKNEFSIHQKLESGHGIHAIKDDFNAWRLTNYRYTTSKPIWFDPDDLDPPSHHILFDDNFRVIDPHDSIVDIRIMNRERQKCYSCPFEYYPQLENVFAVQADLYLILADKDYYVKAVEQCEANLDRLLHDSQTLHEIKTKSCIEH